MISVRNAQSSLAGCKESNSWCERKDVNKDGRVNVFDLIKVRNALGKDCNIMLSPQKNIFEKIWDWIKRIF